MKSTLLLVLSAISLASAAQVAPFGPKGLALGGATVTQTDAWAVFYNPAGLTGVETFSAVLGSDRRAWLPGLETFGLGLVLPTSVGPIGLTVKQYGDRSYREQQASLQFARQLGPEWSLGLGLEYGQVSIANYGRSRVLTGQFGLQYQPVDALHIGIRVYNPFQASLSLEADEAWPTLFSAGAMYAPAKGLAFTAQVDQSLEGALRVRCGLDYEVLEALRLRVGFSTVPATPHAGFGFRLKALDLDLGAAFHPYTGVAPALGLQWPAPGGGTSNNRGASNNRGSGNKRGTGKNSTTDDPATGSPQNAAP